MTHISSHFECTHLLFQVIYVFLFPFPLFCSGRSLPLAVQGDVATSWVVSVPSAVWYENSPLLSAMPVGWVCWQVLVQVKSSEWSNDQMARCCHHFLHSVCSDHRLSAADPRSLQCRVNCITGVFSVNVFPKSEEVPSWLHLNILPFKVHFARFTLEIECNQHTTST